MSYYKFNPNELTASKLAINLISKCDANVKELTTDERKKLKSNTLVVIRLANSVIMDNIIFNIAFKDLFDSTQLANFMNYAKLLHKKVQSTVYRRSYFTTHINFRRGKDDKGGASQRHNKSYNKLTAEDYAKVYITDMEKV